MNTDQFSPGVSDNMLDRVIHDIQARPAPPDIKDRVLAAALAYGPRQRAQVPRILRRSWLLLGSAAVATSAACVLAFLLFPSASAGWTDVTAAVNAQKWIRATTTYLQGGQGRMWYSPQRQVWAFQTPDVLTFCDGREQAKYEYRKGSREITKMPLGEENGNRVLPVNDLLQGKAVLGPWLFGSEKIVAQQRREVSEGGRKWIEFQMVLARGATNQATLRVDPTTRLPVYLRCVSPTDPARHFQWTFDYPAEGPADIYALGVPAQTRIDDHMPSGEAARALQGIAAGRARIGDFRLMVAREGPFGSAGSIVWRKGDRWRVDDYSTYMRLPPMTKPADGQSWSDWFAQRFKRCRHAPWLVCDGKTVYHNAEIYQGVRWEREQSMAPQDMFSGQRLGNLPGAEGAEIGSLVYPDLTPWRSGRFEFDPHPPDAPGCVLIKQSAELSVTRPNVGHNWYYLDPTKGYAVVRIELFELPPQVPADPRTAAGCTSFRMEDFQLTPQGFWYPRTIHETNRSTEPAASSSGATGTALPGGHMMTGTAYYDFDFTAALPDSLFVVDHAGDAKK